MEKLYSRYSHVFFVFLFMFLAFFLHKMSWNQLPKSVHAWAQSDHFALSIGFIDNGFNFFNPTTFSLNHQFPPTEQLANPKGITAVDFPVLHFLVASLMKLIDSTEPEVFRVTMLSVSFLSLWFLFSTIRRNVGTAFGFFLTGFVMLTPVYTYYQDGFHVSMAAFNMFLIGACFMLRYYNSNKDKLLVFGVVFLTLAALMRFTQIISLLAFACMLFCVSIKNKKFDNRLWLVSSSLLLVFGYFIYNKYLASRYGSVFLNKPIIASSFKTLFKDLFHMLFMYLKFLLPPLHLLALIFLGFFVFKRVKKINLIFRETLLWFIFLFAGTLAFTMLMSWSLSVHDYYALDTWIPVIVFFLLFFINDYKKAVKEKYYRQAIVVFCIGAFFYALFVQHWRYSKTTTTDTLIEDFKISSTYLDSFIPNDAKILIICGHGWNTPMVGWRRQVYRVAWHFPSRIPEELANNYDYVVTHNASFESVVYRNYPNYINHMEKIDTNALVTIWKQKKP